MKAAKGPHGVYNENYTAAMKNPPGERLDLYTLCMYLQIEYIPPANRLPWSRWHCMPLMLGRHGKEAVGDYISNPEVHSSFSLFYNLRLHVSKTFTSCELDLTQPWRLKLYSARKKKDLHALHPCVICLCLIWTYLILTWNEPSCLALVVNLERL